MTGRHTERTDWPIALRGRAVMLRDFRPGDLDGVRGIVGDDRVTYHLSFNSRNTEQARAMLHGIMDRARQTPRGEYYLAITPLDSAEPTGPADPAPADRVLGFARLVLGPERAGRIGYAVAHEHQGRGFAGDAARTLLDFAFGRLRLHRVTAVVAPDNMAGLASVERLGFTREGVLRDHVHTNGAWRDSILFSLLAPEWNPDPDD